MLSHPLLPKLKQLRLSGIATTLNERAAKATANSIRPVDFLALLLEDELDRRQQSRHDRFVRRAGFQQIKLLADFNFDAAPTLDRSLVMTMATCQFIRRHENRILCGRTGLGKSHLAAAIGFETIKLGYTVIWTSAHEMLADLFAGRADGSYRREFRMPRPRRQPSQNRPPRQSKAKSAPLELARIWRIAMALDRFVT
jgi:DNA replication protein DnaC